MEEVERMGNQTYDKTAKPNDDGRTKALHGEVLMPSTYKEPTKKNGHQRIIQVCPFKTC